MRTDCLLIHPELNFSPFEVINTIDFFHDLMDRVIFSGKWTPNVTKWPVTNLINKSSDETKAFYNFTL